ncbi:MAG: crotonase/enoyl-CoA hydratase family protein [Actinomycetota bacterium]
MAGQVTTTAVPIDGDADGRTIARIDIDDGKANALSFSMITDIRAAITAAEADTTCVAAVLAGREGRFSAGFDLSVVQGEDPSAIVNLVADGGDLVRHLYGASIPVVAACTGHALAAGALMLLGCDVRIGADGPFKVGLNEVAIGMTLPGWAYTICRERLSNRHLQRSLPTARITEPAGAVDVGFLDQVVPADELIDAAMAEAASMAALDPRAYRRMIGEFRGDALVLMSEQIAAERGS